MVFVRSRHRLLDATATVEAAFRSVREALVHELLKFSIDY